MSEAIIIAAKMGDVAAVKAELDSGVSPDARGSNGITALHLAAEMGRIEVIRLLLDREADVNAKDTSADLRDATPLHHAAMTGSAESARLLLERGADVHALERNGWSPLHRAARSSHMSGSPEEFVQVLVAAGADIGAKDRKGRTPLHVAVEFEFPRMAQALIGAGADRNAVDDEGKTPYDVVCKMLSHLDHEMFDPMKRQRLAALERVLKPSGCLAIIFVAIAVFATIVALCLLR